MDPKFQVHMSSGDVDPDQESCCTIDRDTASLHTPFTLIALGVGNGTKPLAMDARDGLGN